MIHPARSVIGSVRGNGRARKSSGLVQVVGWCDTATYGHSHAVRWDIQVGLQAAFN